jgi:CDP-diacylglycerol---glycerol-3-phosphate 3-phosphatidyltransferase
MRRIVESTVKKSKSLEDHFRGWFKGSFQVVASFLARLGIRPNSITLMGLIGHFIAGYLVINGRLSWAGVLLLLMAPLDYLDGTMARLQGESSQFGALFDSVTDRYSEFVILGSILFYYMDRMDRLACVGVYLALIGSIMVSYTRSRGETLGLNMKVGVLTRIERYLVLLPGLIFQRPDISAWIIALLGNYTALQRIIHVQTTTRDQVRQDEKEH